MKIKMELSGQPVVLTVPEGMDPQDYANQVSQRHAQTVQESDSSAASESSIENFRAGIGRGMVNVGRQVGNIVGAISDEEMAEHRKRDEDLLETGAGTAGNLVGEIAATAPIGGVVGAAGKGLRAVSTGSNVLSKAGRMAGSVPGIAASEGAAVGSLLAGPENRGSGAVGGAAIAGAIPGVGKVLQKSLGKPWINKSREAMRVERMTGKEIPLSQSGTGLGKNVYSGFVANMPGGSRRVRRQFRESLDDWRQFVAEEALPPGSDRVFRSTDDMQTVFKKMGKAWDDAYDFQFKKAPVVAFKDTLKGRHKVWDRFRKEGMEELKPGKEYTGQNILNLKRDIANVRAKIDSEDWRDYAQLDAVDEAVDDLLKRNFNPSGKGRGLYAQELAQYEAMKPAYRRFQDMLSAANKSTRSEFSPKSLNKATNARAGRGGVSGSGALNRESKHAIDALEDFPSKEGIFQTVAAVGLGSMATGGAMLGGPVGGAVGLALPATVANILSRKGVQRTLAGQSPKLRKFAKAWRKKHGPRLERTLPYYTPAVVAPTVEDE